MPQRQKCFHCQCKYDSNLVTSVFLNPKKSQKSQRLSDTCRNVCKSAVLNARFAIDVFRHRRRSTSMQAALTRMRREAPSIRASKFLRNYKFKKWSFKNSKKCRLQLWDGPLEFAAAPPWPPSCWLPSFQFAWAFVFSAIECDAIESKRCAARTNRFPTAGPRAVNAGLNLKNWKKKLKMD